MLIKEYRILLPLTVEEYRIAQLYMIQKKSRIDSSGAGSGVEILKNEPYENGPGGSGQYTYKVYHIGSKIPAWIRSILPTAACEAVEEAWNAYPCTKTKYSTPMLDRLNIEVETVYRNDAGTEDNIFQLTKDELKQRQIDVMDFVNDPISSHDYIEEEDPKLYRSRKTGRGVLNEDWIDDYKRNNKPMMCAYKLCRVEFRYWGMQTRVESWIHERALRGTMLRAHRQAWAWQDEWVDLTINDIRKLEKEAAAYLQQVMNGTDKNNTEPTDDSDEEDATSDIFFDCIDQSPPHTQKPSLIRWSSELLINESDSPPVTPKTDPSSSLLILVFHGDIYPESPADSKTTDSNSLRSTLDTLISSHYVQLKNKVHVLRVSCGGELSGTVSMLNGICSSFGSFHPSLALLLASNSTSFYEAVQGTISKANQVVADFLKSDAGKDFNGEIFTVGDCIGGVLMYEALVKHTTTERKSHPPVSRHSSSISSHSRIIIPENTEVDQSNWSLHDFPPSPNFDTKENNDDSVFMSSKDASVNTAIKTAIETANVANNVQHPQPVSMRTFPRNLSAPPSASYIPRKKMSTSSVDTNDMTPASLSIRSNIAFRPTTAFLLGCPLALVLTQRKLQGREADQLECDQLFNLFYSLDACGSRLEPVLNPQLALLPALNVPRYQRYPLGDGRHILFDNALESSMIWGNRRIDHQLYCPAEMISLPSAALPNILHASYWESKDVGGFILRQFVRSEENHAFTAFSTSAAASSPLDVEMPPASWNRRRTRFKIANLSANHRANDIITVEGNDQILHAKFCYGPMDLVSLSREEIFVFICPSGGEWYQYCSECTDAHGRLTVNLGTQLPVGVHAVKMVVRGDHSYLNMFLAVVPHETRCVVFSIDGSLTGSVSVTGRDPRVRAGAVDVARFWQKKNYIIIYVTARPDMQQKLVGSWLAQHNFPHGLLFFTPSISTDPLRHKTQHIRHLVDIGIKIQAAYGSSKDVPVYTAAGVDPDHIFKVSGSRKRGCISLEDGYAQHLHDLHSGRVPIAQPIAHAVPLIIDDNFFTPSTQPDSRSYVQRTHSFTPRSGKYDSFKQQGKKTSQISISTR